MKRTLLLLFLFVCIFGVYYYQYGISNPLTIVKQGLSGEIAGQPAAPLTDPTATPESLDLDEETIALIESLTSGVEVKPHENNIAYAIKLDHQTGRPLFQQRKHRETYEVYKKVLKISYDNQSLMGIQIALGVMSEVYKNLGQFGEGEDLLMLAYKIALKQDDPREYGVYEKRIADHIEKNDRGMSLMWRLKAREHLQGTTYIQDYVGLLIDIADDMAFFERDDEAMALYLEAYELSKKINNNPNIRWTIKYAQYEYAWALFEDERCSEALPIIKNHLNTFNNDRDKSEWYYTSMLHLQGKCLAAMDQDEAALHSYMQAFSSYELRRSLANSDEDRAGMDDGATSLINRLVNGYLDIPNLKEGLLVLETSKARTLTDIIADPAQKEIYQQWKDLQVRHSQEMENMFSVPEDDELLPAESSTARREKYFATYKKQREEVFALKLSQQSKQVITSARMTPEDIINISKNMPADTVALSVFVGNETVGLFAITNRDIKYYPSQYERSNLRRRVKEIKFMIGNPKVDYYKIPSQEIYKGVFEKMLKELGPRYKRLVVSLDGYFQNLPLGILYDGKQFLAERYIIQQYPSLRYYKPENTTAAKIPDKGLTCVDPELQGQRLPFQRETSTALKALAGDKVTELVGKKCSSANIVQQLAELDKDGFLHIGAHGVFTSYDPMRSGIILQSEPEERSPYFWNAMEIGTADMRNIKLLTLSSCSTGVIDEERSRDVFGILRGVFLAGVDNVIAPLWPVEDLPTATLMQSFYRYYLQDGDPAQSLQKAQQGMIKGDKYKHPYFWGAFIAMGSSA